MAKSLTRLANRIVRRMKSNETKRGHRKHSSEGIG